MPTPYQNTRISRHFTMLDFMQGSEIYGSGRPLPYETCMREDALRELRAYCEHFLEPVIQKFGPVSVACGFRPSALLSDQWKSPHLYNEERGAAGDIAIHDLCVENIAPIKQVEAIMHARIPWERLITYAGSEFICSSYRIAQLRYAVMENVRKEPKPAEEVAKPDYVCWSNGGRGRLPEHFPKRENWRRNEGEPVFHGGRRVRAHHLRVGRYFVLSDFCRSEEGIAEGVCWVPPVQFAEQQIRVARMFAAILDPLTGAIGRISPLKGLLPVSLAKTRDEQAFHRWLQNRGQHRFHFLLPEGVEPDDPAVTTWASQQAGRIVDLGFAEHVSEAIEVRMTIQPFDDYPMWSSAKTA